MNHLFSILMAGLVLSLGGCVAPAKYVERNSEALSRTVYATGDCILLGRVELAKEYNQASQKLVPPPKDRISISPAMIGSNSVVTLPKAYAGQSTMTVGSVDYDKIIQTAEDNKELQKQLLVVDQERQNQDQIHSQLLRDWQTGQVQIQTLEKKIAQKNIHIIILYLVIASFIGTIVLGFYLKVLSATRIF